MLEGLEKFQEHRIFLRIQRRLLRCPKKGIPEKKFVDEKDLRPCEKSILK